MKIRRVTANNRKRLFEVEVSKGTLTFPYAKADPRPSPDDPIERVFVDPELGRECFTWELASGAEGSLHVDSVLEENLDPDYMADLIAYELSVEARDRIEKAGLSRREIMRRLGTSASQLYRLLDADNTRTSMHQLVALLTALGCEVSFTVRDASKRPRRR